MYNCDGKEFLTDISYIYNSILKDEALVGPRIRFIDEIIHLTMIVELVCIWMFLEMCTYFLNNIVLICIYIFFYIFVTPFSWSKNG